MIYIDSSVVLAELLSDDRRPPPVLWEDVLVSSRLVEYETWTRINARGLIRTHSEDARTLLGRIAFLELSPPILERALDPFPVTVRTLDALHLASLSHVRSRRADVGLATYDVRMRDAASKLGFGLYELDG